MSTHLRLDWINPKRMEELVSKAQPQRYSAR
jgi:hypothetical protein